MKKIDPILSFENVLKVVQATQGVPPTPPIKPTGRWIDKVTLEELEGMSEEEIVSYQDMREQFEEDQRNA
jgi:hypothetical protein